MATGDWWSDNGLHVADPGNEPQLHAQDAAPGNDDAWLDQKIQQYGLDPAERPYWQKTIREGGGVQAMGAEWLDDAIHRADSSADVLSGKIAKRGAGGAGGNQFASGGFGAAPPDFANPDLPAGLQSPFSLGRFTAPTAVTMENDPGYQFRMDEGDKGLERSAAAKGSVLAGGFQKALARYNQDYASNEFGNVYNRALGTFNANTGASLAERGQQVSEYQNQVGNAQNQYGINLSKNRNAQTDYWTRLNDVSNRGANASGIRP